MGTDADGIYDRVNEVVCCDRQGMTPLEIATFLELDVAEVDRILRNPILYQRAHGLKGHGYPATFYMPTPEEIEAQAAIERAASEAAKAARGPHAHGYHGSDYNRQVFPRHPHNRRTGY